MCSGSPLFFEPVFDCVSSSFSFFFPPSEGPAQLSCPWLVFTGRPMHVRYAVTRLGAANCRKTTRSLRTRDAGLTTACRTFFVQCFRNFTLLQLLSFDNTPGQGIQSVINNREEADMRHPHYFRSFSHVQRPGCTMR